MGRNTVRFATLAVLLAAGFSLRAAAQQQAAPPEGLAQPPTLLVIYREEVKPGHATAHAANESAWAAAFNKGNSPSQWLGMTSILGPTEAWFLSRYDNYEAWQKAEEAVEATPALHAADERFSAQETDHLTRASTMVARLRPGLSYQSAVDLPLMRYMQVDVVRVKPGQGPMFREAWQMLVQAHTTAKMDEHWAVYEVEAGAEAGTFLFLYPHRSMAGFDASGPMHGGGAYRDAVGEAGRQRLNEVYQESIVSQITYVFRLRPAMSVVTQSFIDRDPGFWAVKAPEAAPAAPAAATARKR